MEQSAQKSATTAHWPTGHWAPSDLLQVPGSPRIWPCHALSRPGTALQHPTPNAFGPSPQL